MMNKKIIELNSKNQTADYAPVAKQLRQVYATGKCCEPVRAQLPADDLEAAYSVQNINTEYWLAKGRKYAGCKIGLTSNAVQKQLGVAQPDYGILFQDMAFSDSEVIPYATLQQPRIEGEIAFYLKEDLNSDALTCADVMSAIDYALAAFEVVGSRIQDWNINIVDTIADNASSGVYVLGHQARRLNEFDLRLCGAVVEYQGEPVSTGAGAACLGNPMNAVTWLACKMAEVGRPLGKGDLVLSGALGPMISINPGDKYELRISGLGSVCAVFSTE